MARGRVPGHAVAYTRKSTHTSLEEAKIALHSLDASEYVAAYNYGAFGNAKVYRCISHQACPRRVRVVEEQDDEEEIPVTFHVEVAGQHGDVATNRKRAGIDLAVKAEVDGLLAKGILPKKCRLTLEKRYEDEPVMLAKLPNESQLKNRLQTLKKHGWGGPQTDSMASSPGCRPSRQQQESSDSEEEQEEEVSSTADDDTSSDRQEEVELDVEDAERFDKKKLMEEFTALPGRPVFWNILKKTRYIKDKSESVVTEWITGQVIGWQTSDNVPTEWMVKFSDGEKRRLELEELVDEIRASAQLGLNVTGQPINL